MGYYPSKVCIALNILTNIGYSMVSCVTGGQILSRISGGQISVLVGIVVVAVTSWAMAMFGMRIFQIYERFVTGPSRPGSHPVRNPTLMFTCPGGCVSVPLRFAWLPQLMVLCVMLGSAGPHFDFSIHTPVSQDRLNAKRVTFFSLGVSVALAWAPLAADYYVFHPPHIKRWQTFAATVLGSSQAMMITLLMGIGLGSMMASSPLFLDKYGRTPGGLLMAAYDALGGFGKFCAVINVLSLVANNTPGAYSMGMNLQMLGGFFGRVPQPIFTTLATVIYTACAMGGRNSLYEVFKSFLPLIGYWVMIWLVIVVQEDLCFRRSKEYDWSTWNSPQQLPLGLAAGASFLVGWAGAVIGMVRTFNVLPETGFPAADFFGDRNKPFIVVFWRMSPREPISVSGPELHLLPLCSHPSELWNGGIWDAEARRAETTRVPPNFRAVRDECMR